MRRGLLGICSAAIASIGVLVLVSGCLGRSPEVRLFTLGSQSQLERSERAPELAVLIGPVRLPSYLERPQIARRLGGGEVQLDEFNRWVGGFEENLIRALTEGIRRQLGSARVVGYPSRVPFPMDYRVRLDVDELIVDESNRLRLQLRWVIASEVEGERPSLSTFEREIAAGNRSVEALIEAHDRVLSELAQAIADQLVALSEAR
jgi:uncharacterized lipoprotein YmbA